jgi:hypothetical protein
VLSLSVLAMTMNFGTDNIFYVPQHDQLHLFDIYHWRRIDFDVHRFNVFLDERYLWRINEKLLEIAERCEVDKDALARFLAQIRTHHAERPDKSLLQEALQPQALTLWARLSDGPQESFAREDYEISDQTPFEAHQVPLYGSFFLSSLQGYELNLPFEEGNEAFVLEIPRNASAAVAALPTEGFLPILDEFCGYYGYSNRGNLVNYTMKGEISPDCLGCLPLFQIGDDLFATLYFHIGTPVNRGLTVSVPENGIDDVLAALKKSGFTICREQSENWILSRDRDVIHYYANAAGKESLGSRFLSPFFIVASSGGQLDPEPRAQLCDDLRKRLSLPR